jgi:outer membrane protein assembly factor BamB
VFSPPAIANGHLFVGMGNGDYVHQAEDIGQEPTGAVWCIDLKLLNVRWKFPVQRTVLGAVAVMNDRLYFGSRDGRVYCLDLEGKLIATWNAHAPIIASVAITDHQVLAVANSGVLYALDRMTLELLWEQRLGTEPAYYSSPAVARGLVFVGTQHNGLLAIGEPGTWGARRRVPLWSGRLGRPGAAGNLDNSILASWGSFHWNYPADQMGETDEAIVLAPAAAVENDLLVPLVGAAGRSGLACLPGDATEDETPAVRWHAETDNGVFRSPAVCGDTVFIVDGKPGDTGRALYSLERHRGELRWSSPVAEGASGQLACTLEEVFIQDAPETLSCLAFSGEPRWSQPVGPLVFAPALQEDLLVILTNLPAAGSPADNNESRHGTMALTVLDRLTGRELWRLRLDAAARAGPVIDGDAILLATDHGVQVHSLIDGSASREWAGPGEGVSGDIALDHDRLAYVSDAGELVVVTRPDGHVLHRLAGAVPGLPPLVSHGRILYFSAKGLMAFTFPEDGEVGDPVVWADTSWLGRPTTPMVLSASNVYAGMAGWGLVRLGASP